MRGDVYLGLERVRTVGASYWKHNIHFLVWLNTYQRLDVFLIFQTKAVIKRPGLLSHNFIHLRHTPIFKNRNKLSIIIDVSLVVAAKDCQDLVICGQDKVIDVAENRIESEAVHTLQTLLQHNFISEHVMAVDVF